MSIDGSSTSVAHQRVAPVRIKVHLPVLAFTTTLFAIIVQQRFFQSKNIPTCSQILLFSSKNNSGSLRFTLTAVSFFLVRKRDIVDTGLLPVFDKLHWQGDIWWWVLQSTRSWALPLSHFLARQYDKKNKKIRSVVAYAYLALPFEHRMAFSKMILFLRHRVQANKRLQ